LIRGKNRINQVILLILNQIISYFLLTLSQTLFTMKKHIVLFILTLFLALTCQAQLKKGISYSGFFDSYYWRGPVSITGSLGLTGYTGDLCSDFSCAKILPYFSVGLGYKLWPRVFVGGEIDYFSLGAKDIYPSRGYEFKSKNIELAGYVNFFLIEDVIRRHNDLFVKHHKLKPYIYLGLSGMRYSVNVNVSETSFPKYTMLVPIGAGLKYEISPRVHLAAEAIYKISFTDYLDGISQLANPNKNDGYGITRIKLIYTPGVKRVHKKTQKISKEEKEKWIKHYSQDSSAVAPKKEVAPDPEESDPFYKDTPKEVVPQDIDTPSDKDAPATPPKTGETTPPKKAEEAYDW
jgi:hypothetical protein